MNTTEPTTPTPSHFSGLPKGPEFTKLNQDMPTCPDALRRHRSALAALLAHLKENASRSILSDPTPEEAITDLLADLMHLCSQNGMDFDRYLASAMVHHMMETEEADAQAKADALAAR